MESAKNGISQKWNEQEWNEYKNGMSREWNKQKME